MMRAVNKVTDAAQVPHNSQKAWASNAHRGRSARYRSFGVVATLMMTLALALALFVTAPSASLPVSWTVLSTPGNGDGRAKAGDGSHGVSSPASVRKGSIRLSLEELNAVPLHEISSDEARDVFLMRPNWRRAAQERRPYVYRGTDADGRFDEAAYEAEKQRLQSVDLDAKENFTFHLTPSDRSREGVFVENINAKAVRDAEDEERVRVFLLTYTNRFDDMFCKFMATAHLTNIPVNIVAYKHNHANFTDKVWEMQQAAHRAGLRPQDVILFYDSDVVFYSGQELVRAIDRFIRYSPESQDELDARDVRDDSGEMLAPVLFSAELYCFYRDFLGSTKRGCEVDSGEYAMNAWGDYLRKSFPGKGQVRDPRHYMGRFLNSGGIISRMWAWDVYAESFRKFVRGAGPPVVPHHVNKGIGYVCDQAVGGALWMTLLKHEAESDIFHPKAERTSTTSGTPPPPRYANDRYGTPAGLVGLDYYNEFFAQLHWNTIFAKFSDRYLQAAALAQTGRLDAANADGVTSWLALEREKARMQALSFVPKSRWRETMEVLGSPPRARREGVDGEGEQNPGLEPHTAFTLQVSRRYFSRRTSLTSGLERHDGSLKAIKEHVATRIFTPYHAPCVVDAFYQVNSGLVSSAVADGIVLGSRELVASQRAQLAAKRSKRAEAAAKEVSRLKESMAAAERRLTDVVARSSLGENGTREEAECREALKVLQRDVRNAEGTLRGAEVHAREAALAVEDTIRARDAAAAAVGNLSASDAAVAKRNDFNCFAMPHDRCTPCRPIDWFARPRPVARQPAGQPVSLFTKEPLYLSHTPDVRAIMVSPPVLLAGLFYEPHEAKEVYVHPGQAIMEYQTPTSVHAPGGAGKKETMTSAFHTAPWLIPLFYGADREGSERSAHCSDGEEARTTIGSDCAKEGVDAGFEKVAALLATLPVPAFGDDFRATLRYADVCRGTTTRWFTPRAKRPSESAPPSSWTEKR